MRSSGGGDDDEHCGGLLLRGTRSWAFPWEAARVPVWSLRDSSEKANRRPQTSRILISGFRLCQHRREPHGLDQRVRVLVASQVSRHGFPASAEPNRAWRRALHRFPKGFQGMRPDDKCGLSQVAGACFAWACSGSATAGWTSTRRPRMPKTCGLSGLAAFCPPSPGPHRSLVQGSPQAPQPSSLELRCILCFRGLSHMYLGQRGTTKLAAKGGVEVPANYKFWPRIQDSIQQSGVLGSLKAGA